MTGRFLMTSLPVLLYSRVPAFQLSQVAKTGFVDQCHRMKKFCQTTVSFVREYTQLFCYEHQINLLLQAKNPSYQVMVEGHALICQTTKYIVWIPIHVYSNITVFMLMQHATNVS